MECRLVEKWEEREREKGVGVRVGVDGEWGSAWWI